MLQTFVHPTGVISGSDFKTVKIYSEGKMSLNDKPAAERVHIGFFGLRNAGKSSLVNAVTGQNLALVSDIKRDYNRSCSKNYGAASDRSRCHH